MKKKGVFLDRDGVLNRVLVREGKPYPPSTLSELEIPPDVPMALDRLHGAGFRLVVVTNQPDVARGRQTRAGVEAIHAEMRRRLPLDEFRTCFHDDADRCACRKPAPGLLLKAAREHGIDLGASWMVGDAPRDLDAGRAAGCRTVALPPAAGGDLQARSLAEAVQGLV